MFFPIIFYLMMINNFYGISYFSIGNIMDYFKIPRTTRNLNDIIICLDLMESEGIIRKFYSENESIKMNDLIAYEVFGKETPFVQIQDFEIEKLIELYVNEEPNYMFSIVFMLLKLKSFTSPTENKGMAIETAHISYSTIMDMCDIKSTTTMTKYVNLMREYGLFTILEDLEVETYKDSSGVEKKIFRTKYTYNFKEREM